MILLINLADSVDRLHSATGFLDAAGLAAQRVDAVDGHKTDLTARPEYDAALARRWYGRDLAASEIGCFLSHRKCAQMFLDSDADYALALEDDLVMPADFASVLDHTLDWLAAHYAGRWDAVNFGAAARKVLTPLERMTFSGGETQLCAAHIFPLTCTAILWSREGAEWFLRDTAVIYAPIDQFLRNRCTRSDRGLAFDVPPISTTGAESTIDYALAKAHKQDRRRQWRKHIARKLQHQKYKFTALRNKSRFRPVGTS
ncbi:glycosyltransferase family 25 protein [Actibacterium sp. D379-3]